MNTLERLIAAQGMEQTDKDFSEMIQAVFRLHDEFCNSQAVHERFRKTIGTRTSAIMDVVSGKSDSLSSS